MYPGPETNNSPLKIGLLPQKETRKSSNHSERVMFAYVRGALLMILVL